MIPIRQTFLSAYAVEFLPKNWKGAGLLNIPFIKQHLYWPKFLQVIFFLLFLCIIDGEQSTLVCCHNVTPACTLAGFLIISSVSIIVNVVCRVILEAACLLILDSLEAIIIAQLAQWSPDYKMWNHSISMRTGRCRHQSFWNEGLFSSNAEVSGFLEYQLHIKLP